ncbi:MAG: tetratricopeptide repeat protein [Verrucomicrobiota bacterium]
MKKFIFLALMVSLAGAQAATPQRGRDSLRQLLRLPSINTQFGFNFQQSRGFVFETGERDAAREVRELEQALANEPPNPERLFQLGRLQEQAGNHVSARNAYAKAVQLARKQIESRPEDALLLVALGQSLAEMSEHVEAESVLRRATRLAPREARAWLALGVFLDQRAWAELMRHLNLPPSASFDLLVGSLSQRKPSGEQVEAARKYVEEAGACLDTAIRLAPDEGEAYGRRALCRGNQNVLRVLVNAAGGQAVEPSALLKAAVARANTADVWRRAELNRNNHEALGQAVFYEVMAWLLDQAREEPPDLADGDFWDQLPDEVKARVRDGLGRLEEIAQGANAKHAAGALEMRGIIQLIVQGDKTGGETSFRRAVALDPSRGQAWELLMIALADMKRNDDLLRVCEQRVQQQDTPRARLALAKAHERLKQYDRAEKQLEAGLRFNQNDFAVNLGLCALLARRANDDDTLRRAGEHLQRAIRASNPPSRERLIDLNLTGGIYFALAGDAPAARRMLRQVIQIDPDNEAAKAALTAVN